MRIAISRAGVAGAVLAYRPVDAPMGGMNASGLGRRHGEHGILKYTEPQTIAIERGLPVGRRLGCAPIITRAS
jgi:succinate-semialdehyde dehydrogenase / glutarate-semialdehyde dehydrogenase